MRYFFGFLALVTAPVLADSVVVFNEVHYHPDTAEASREYIEFHNQMAVDVDMSGWKITGGVDYAFPSGTVIPGRGYIVVAVNPAGVQAAYGASGVLGPWTGRLSNSGEDLHLRDNNGREMDEIDYGTGGKWTPGADGAGPSLTKINPNSASEDAANWTTSWQTGGTPGSANFPDPNAPFVPPAGLVSYWRMDEGSGGSIVDAAGGNTGTLAGGATRTAGLTGSGALSFDNTAAASVNAGTGANLTVTGGITIEALFKSAWNGTGSDTLYSRNNAAVTTNLAAWYAFDEAASGTAAAGDAAGGPNGSFIGTATRTAGAGGSVGAVHCNNAGADGVNIGSGLSFTTGLTISAWIKPLWTGNSGDYDEIIRKEDGNNRILFSFQNDANNPGASPPVAAGPVLSFGLNTAGTYRELDMPLDGASGRPTLAALKDGSFHHVAVTYDAATGVKAMYVDGTLRFSTIHSGNISSGGGAAAVIGNTSTGGGEPFNGDIDDVALFKVALTGAQIQSLYDRSSTPVTVLPSAPQPPRVLVALQNDGNNAAANPPVSAGPVLSFGLNTGGTYSELDMPLDGAAGRPTVAQLTDGQEHHVAATYDAVTGVKSIFIDGTVRYSTTLSGAVSSAGTAAATLGNLAPGGSDAWTGVIDEVAYWSKALTPADIAQHWAKAQGSTDYFAVPFTSSPPPSLRVNELGPPLTFFIELQNTGAASLDLTGYVIKVDNASYVLPSQSLAAGALLTLTGAQLGITPAAGAKIHVLNPAGQLTDSVESGTAGRGRTASGEWATTSGSTQGTANTFAFHNEVVINEIMYHPRPVPGSPAVMQNSTLVPLTASWTYRDNGQDLGTAWKETGYTDNSWPSGTGMLGSANAGGAYSAAVAADTPLAYWKLDDATTSIADASGNNRTGTATAGVILGTAPLVSDGAGSKSITLSGANRITVPGFEKIGPGGYSVEYWVKVVTAPTSFMNLVGDGDSGGDFFMMNYITPGSAIRQHFGTINSPVSLDAPSALVTGQTYHIVSTWDAVNATGNASICINGVADVTGTVSRTLPAAGTTGNNSVYIGYDNREPASGSYMLDEIALYNRPLSAARVAAHYGAGAVPSPRNTTLATGPSTHYFRTTFNFTGNPAATELFVNLACDDGAVVYLNGSEIRRDNMPAGIPSYATPAASERAGIALSGPVAVPAGALHAGENVIAVEVHQSSGGNSDVFMGLELTARETLVPAIPAGESKNTWIELHNKTGSPVDLTGWRLDGGADFPFAASTSIPANGFLVIANEPALFAAAHPGVLAAGPLASNLSRSGERIILRDAAGNIADSVSYHDGGRWPEDADGFGSSLELRDPRSDNAAAESWAASDQSAGAAWQTYTYRSTIAADGGPTNYNEFVLGLLDQGEVLLDDIHVISQPGTGTAVEIITGGNMETGATAWRMVGTHRNSSIIPEPGNAANHVMRVVSTGGTEVMSNHIELTLNNNTPVVNGREYEISFRAKWLRGGNLLNTRLYWNRAAKVTRLAVPDNGGTPGAANSRFLSNAGPSFSGLRHSPVVPAAQQACTVSIEASDPDNVASATLWYSISGGAWASTPMTVAGSTWSASINGQNAGTVVQFYVRAADGQGATADFPADSQASRALIQWNDGQANLGLAHNVRLILTNADRTLLFTNTNVLSDDRTGCTVIYDESEVFYDCGVRLKGSEHGRADTGRQGYAIAFPADHKFRGVHDSVHLDRSGGWRFGRTTGQDEILVKHIISHAGGVASLQDDIVRVISPQAGHTGPALLQMARYGQDYLDSIYQDGSDGQLYKMEIAYIQSATDNGQPTGNKQAQEGGINNIDLSDRGANPEDYRWFYQHQNNTDQDDFSPIMPVVRAFAKSGAAFDAEIDPLIDNDEWMRAMALESLCGITDIFSRDNGHNVNFYQRPKDGKVLMLPWDWDFSFNASTSSPLWSGRAISKLIQRPHNLRRFYGHLQNIMSTTFNTAYMARWTDHYDNFTPQQDFSSILTWIGQRAAFVQSQIPAPAAWAVTTAPAANALVSTGSVSFAGTAPFTYNTVQFETAGTDPVEAAFSSLNNWAATVPILLGRNVIPLRVYDPQGVLMPGVAQDFVVIGTSSTGYADADSDGLPDAWENSTGLDDVPGATANSDDDGDGQTNLQEYLAGTDPLNGASVLTVDVQSVAGSAITLTLEALAGHTYRVQSSSSLTPGSWITEQTIAPLSADQTLHPVVNAAPGAARVFVRVLAP
ncbi:MAG TPA: LamG-like jellyroll fold domain-containing protein [Verrucomicrobiales bacterium]|nr:LamG-like jellyroll fold domain-containing protein [Verrucomicrobiales bacterium]